MPGQVEGDDEGSAEAVSPIRKGKAEELPEVHVEGWRVYKVIPSLGILHSVAVADAILSREPPACKCPCPDGERPAGPPPHAGVTCGYFAFYEKAAALREANPKNVIAKVTALGDTVLCEGGFQAGRIRIEELWVEPKPLRQGTINALAERYEVEVYELEEEECKLASQSSESALRELLAKEAERAMLASLRPPSPGPPGFLPGLVQSPPPQLGNPSALRPRCAICGDPRPGPGLLCTVCGKP